MIFPSNFSVIFFILVFEGGINLRFVVLNGNLKFECKFGQSIGLLVNKCVNNVTIELFSQKKKKLFFILLFFFLFKIKIKANLYGNKKCL